MDKFGIYGCKHYTLYRELVEYLEDYDTDKVLNTVKKIIGIKKQNSNQSFELRLDYKILGSNLLQSKHSKRVAFLAGLKDSYNGCYIAYSFIAALKSCDSKKVYEEFSSLITKRYPRVKMNIEKTLEWMAMAVWDGALFEEGRCTQVISVEGVKWDRRWLEYAKEKKLPKLIGFFISKVEMTEEEKVINRIYLMQLLEELKKENPIKKLEYYDDLTKKGRCESEKKICSILKGLLLTGESKTVIEHIPYFVNYLDKLGALINRYFSREDLVLFEELQRQIEGLEYEKKRSIISFIREVKKNINCRE